MYEPIGSCRLSNVREVLPIEGDNPRSYTIILNDGRTRTFEFSTAESTIAWHSDLVAALFSFRNTADKLRVSLPLELITKVTTAPYMNLATSVSVEFGTEAATGEDTSDQSKLLEFGFLRTHETFAGLLLSAIDRAHEHPSGSGATVPLPILEIDSPLPPDEVARTEELTNDKTLAAKFVRTFALADHPADLFGKKVAHDQCPVALTDCKLVASQFRLTLSSSGLSRHGDPSRSAPPSSALSRRTT